MTHPYNSRTFDPRQLEALNTLSAQPLTPVEAEALLAVLPISSHGYAVSDDPLMRAIAKLRQIAP